MSSIARGSEGAEVRTIQKELRSLSYLDDPPDGIFGPRTDAAVRMFQTDHDLVVDGIVGPQTRAALDEALESRTGRPGREEGDEGRTEGARPKPGKKRPTERPGKKRPTERPSGKRPTVRPGKKRPTVRPGKKRPKASPGGKTKPSRERPAGGGKRKTAELELHAVGSGAGEASIFTAVVRPEGSNDGHAEKFSTARARFTGLSAGTYRVSIDTKAETFLSPEPRSFSVSLRDGDEKKVDIRF